MLRFSLIDHNIKITSVFLKLNFPVTSSSCYILQHVDRCSWPTLGLLCRNARADSTAVPSTAWRFMLLRCNGDHSCVDMYIELSHIGWAEAAHPNAPIVLIALNFVAGAKN